MCVCVCAVRMCVRARLRVLLRADSHQLRIRRHFRRLANHNTIALGRTGVHTRMHARAHRPTRAQPTKSQGTGALQLIVPLMLSIFVAKTLGDALGPSAYDQAIKTRGAPMLVCVLHVLVCTVATRLCECRRKHTCTSCAWLKRWARTQA